MSKLLSVRGDLLQLIREARIALTEVESDFENVKSDSEVVNVLLDVRDNITTVMMEIEQMLDDQQDYPETDEREHWLI